MGDEIAHDAAAGIAVSELAAEKVAGIYLLEPDGVIAFVNARLARLLGREPAEMIGLRLADFARKADRVPLQSEIARIGAGGAGSMQTRAYFERTDGSISELLSQCSLAQFEGRPAIVGVAIDISPRSRGGRMRSGESRAQLLLESTPNATLFYQSGEDRVVDANHLAEELFECTRADILGAGIGFFRSALRPQGPAADAVFDERVRRALSGEPVDFEQRIFTATGAERLCAVSLVPLPLSTGTLVCVSFFDITERKRAERELVQLNRALRTLSSGSAALIRSENEPELLQAICAVGVEAGGYALAWIGLAEHDDARTVRPVAWAGRGAEYVREVTVSWADTALGHGAIGVAIRTGLPAIIRDFDGDPAAAPWRDAAMKYGFLSCIALPFKDRAGVLGALALYSIEPDAFDKAEVELLVELAGDIAFGLTALRDLSARDSLEARLREVTTNHADRIEALWRIANTPELRGPERIHAMLLQAATAIRPGQRFAGVLGRFDGDDIVVVDVASEMPVDNLHQALRSGRRIRADETLLPYGGRTQAWDDVSAQLAVPHTIAALRWRAIVSTRFETRTARYVLALASAEPVTPAFGAEDSAYVEVLGSSFANQLEVEDLERSLQDAEDRSRHHAERLEALWKLMNDTTLRDEELWLAMLRQAGAAITPGQLYRGLLARIQGTDVVLESVAEPREAGADFETSAIRARIVIPLEGSILGRVIAEGGITRSWDDIEASGVATPAARADGIRAFITTTFRAGGSTWALMFVSREPALRPLQAHEHAYIEVLASYFASHVQQRWQFDRLAYQQSHDVLTGLLNRSQFRSQARTAAGGCEKYALVLVDVNAFHEVNETYGHMIGDALLVEVGAALRGRAAAEDIVGRVGDDVFGVFLASQASKELACERALDLAGSFSRGFSTGDREAKEFIALTASIGLAVGPDDGPRFDAILAHAETALFIAKERGHGSVVLYEAGMEGDAPRRAALRNELTAALSGEEFVLHFQPHVDIGSGEVAGCEALIRWHHPTRGLLLPGEFIPFAEQTGIIASIDAWVMTNALAASEELRRLQPGFRLYFNLSGRQAGDSGIVRAFAEAKRCGVELHNLGIEITESDAMRDVEATRHVCEALRALGVRIAIDDFGTGYSSLASLKELAIDIVKIDRSFISGVLTDPSDEAIAETILSITQRFGFEALGEGVERQAEIDWLRERSCRYAQGYAISRALPMPEFKAWLAAYPAQA